MPWSNSAVTLYHGTDEHSARSIARAAGRFRHGVTIGAGKALVDFGREFYTTTYEHQARNWANMSIRRRPTAGLRGAVLRLEVEREDLAGRADLVFTRDSPEFWDFVTFCRAMPRHRADLHDRRHPLGPYDIVCGPVSIWPQTLVIKDCDQISFHTDDALGVLSDVKTTQFGTPWL